MENKNYKDTLNLPKTNFSMKANLAQSELKIIEKWQKLDIYNRLRKKHQGREKFILHDGPPYANGDIHIGHAVNKILKDIIVKSRTIIGYDSPYVPGWDCHGLPIEHKIETKYSKVGEKMSAEQFREHCRKYALEQIEKQKKDFIRLGIIGDWENPYRTLNKDIEAEIYKSLIEVIDKGYFKKGIKPVYWCLDCKSSLADAEVEYHEKKSFAIYVKFPIESKDKLEKLLGANYNPNLTYSIPIWTTTPWTLIANQAVCANEDIEYQLIQTDNQALFVASKLLSQLIEDSKIKNYKLVQKIKGKQLSGLNLKHPFYDRKSPVILGDHVTDDAGTGFVHTAPDFGLEDYHTCTTYGIDLLFPVDDKGTFGETTQIFAHQNIRKVEQPIIELLTQKGALLANLDFLHSYPHCWRHKTPVIYRATAQWFISINQDFLDFVFDEIEQIDWFPSTGKNRMKGMLIGRPDWCISRQRYWGVPIALLIDKQDFSIHPKMNQIAEKIYQLILEKGIEGWFQCEVSDLINEDVDKYTKVNDVLDVWFDSGTTHRSVLKKHSLLQFPADLYLEGSDQHRGWFQSSLLTSCILNKKAPYKQVLTHGFTVDEKGRKMSKSIGNTIPPQEIIQQYGADILRLWIANTDYSGEIALSKDILKQNADTYRKIRNTARYLIANLYDFNPKKDTIEYEELIELDKWIINQTIKIQKQITDSYLNYNFVKVMQLIYRFCTEDLGSFYLDITKDRNYTLAQNSKARRSAQNAVYFILNKLAKWIAPILSYTAEQIWEFIDENNEKSSVFDESLLEGELINQLHKPKFDDLFWSEVINIRGYFLKELENKRNEKIINASLEAQVVFKCGQKVFDLLNQFGQELKFVTITSKASIELVADEQIINKELGVDFQISKCNEEKCQRCWHLDESINQNQEYLGICRRCIQNIDTSIENETRQFI